MLQRPKGSRFRSAKYGLVLASVRGSKPQHLATRHSRQAHTSSDVCETRQRATGWRESAPCTMHQVEAIERFAKWCCGDKNLQCHLVRLCTGSLIHLARNRYADQVVLPFTSICRSSSSTICKRSGPTWHLLSRFTWTTCIAPHLGERVHNIWQQG